MNRSPSSCLRLARASAECSNHTTRIRTDFAKSIHAVEQIADRHAGHDPAQPCRDSLQHVIPTPAAEQSDGIAELVANLHELVHGHRLFELQVSDVRMLPVQTGNKTG